MIEVTATPVDTTPTNSKQGRSFFDQLKSLIIGAGNNFVGISEEGIWAGAKDFASAPFSVDMAGNVHGISLSGQTITSPTISGGSISGTTISGATISGGTIIGGTIKTADSPDRIELNGADGALYVYVGGDKRLILTDFAISFLGPGEVSGAGIYAGGTNQFTIDIGGGQTFDFNESGFSIFGGPILTSGAGSPEGVVAAPVGSIYMRTNGGAGTSFYVKETGIGNTGWVGK